MQAHFDAPEFQPAVSFMQWWFAANEVLRGHGLRELAFADARGGYEDYLRAHAAEDLRLVRERVAQARLSFPRREGA